MPAAPTFSFEFFPARTPAFEQPLWDAVAALSRLKPSFMTVTYGAGGSGREGTFATLTRLLGETNIPVASHLTFVGQSREEVRAYAERLWTANIRHIVALRGDLPDMAAQDATAAYGYTSAMIEDLKTLHPFEISVAAYPEKHPDAPSLDADIEALRKKCGAGADRAITQFFFDNDLFYRFRDLVEKAGIKTPLVPGLVPIGDFTKIATFAARCHASIPDRLRARFAGLEEKPEETAKIGTELLTAQIADLMQNGVPHFHLYTLNKAPLCTAACHASRLVPAP